MDYLLFDDNYKPYRLMIMIALDVFLQKCPDLLLSLASYSQSRRVRG